MKTYRIYQPRQGFLLAPSPLDWLPEDHLSYFLLNTVAQLDLSVITAYYEREQRGDPPHDPWMMVALLLYAYCVGVPSSRKIEQRTHEAIAFRVLAGKRRYQNPPDVDGLPYGPGRQLRTDSRSVGQRTSCRRASRAPCADAANRPPCSIEQ